MTRRLILLLGALVVVMTAIAMGPRPVVDGTIRFDASAIGSDIDEWLARREAAVPDLKPDAEKEIVWANPATRQKTRLAIVYIHGFSTTKWDIRPLPDKVAKILGANLFLTRLAGHGATAQALTTVTMNDWVNDVAEAIAIGERIGERIVVMGTSTGATLATWAAGNARLMNKVIGLVLVSPSYEVRGASIGLLNMPWGETILPLIYGHTRSFEPINEAHAKWWSNPYPSVAVFPIGALMKAVSEMPSDDRAVPALFIYSPQDRLVVPDATLRVHDDWNAPKRLIEVTETDDPDKHIIAGDILSPATTDYLAGNIIDWVSTLKR